MKKEEVIREEQADSSAVKNTGTVNAVSRALEILNCFTPTQPELTLTQIDQILKYPKSTLLNQIRTLEAAGLLYRVQNSRSYRLGYKLMAYSYNVQSANPVIQYALPVLEELRNQTENFIYLTTHIDGQVFYLECMYPLRRQVRYSIAGKTLPMHCTGAGKAMLSGFSTEQVQRVLDTWGMPASTANTITNREVLLKELEKIRAQGYAIDNEEETVGVVCIARAIRDASGRVAGAVSISGSVQTMAEPKRAGYAALLDTAVNTLRQYAHLFPAAQLNQG